MKEEVKWPFTIKMEEAARTRESVTMRVTADLDPSVVLNKQSILDHYQGELNSIRDKQVKLQSAVLVKVCGDERLADIVKVFESGDERRRETMWRMATAMPAVKEFG